MKAQKQKTDDLPEQLYSVMKMMGINQNAVQEINEVQAKLAELNMPMPKQCYAMAALIGRAIGDHVHQCIQAPSERPDHIDQGIAILSKVIEASAVIAGDGFPMSVLQKGADRRAKDTH